MALFVKDVVALTDAKLVKFMKRNRRSDDNFELSVDE